MPTYMGSTKNGYRFRRPIPTELASFFGKENFVERLGKNYKQAKIRCAELTVETDRALASARSNQAEGASLEAYLKLPREARQKKLSISPELPGQIAALWLNSLEADAQARKEGLSEEEFDSLDANVQQVLPLINRALASGNIGKFHETVNQLLVFRGYQLEATQTQWQALTYEVLKHMQTGYKILAARQNGESLEPPDLSALPPPLVAVWEKQPQQLATPQIKRLADITTLYKAYLETSSPKDRSTYLSIWQRFVDFAENKPLHSVSTADVFNFLNNRLQDDKSPWSYKYVASRVKNVLCTAFGLGRTQQLISKNPMAELEVLPRISAKQEALRMKPRFPYESKHLNALFSSEWYDPNSSAWRGKMKDDLGARYWIPLICMWHGLRVSEAAQLQVEDVLLKDLGLWIRGGTTEFGPERAVKNEATKRKVPIHPALIEKGFVDFVGSIMNHYPQGPLFPAALPERDGKSPKWGRAYEQPFLRFMRDKLAFGHGYGNHSFRHSLEDRIRAANAVKPWPKGLGQAYTGRTSDHLKELEKEGSEKDYGYGYELSAFRRYTQRINYPNVQLPAPFNEWLQGRTAISKQLLSNVQQWKKESHETA